MRTLTSLFSILALTCALGCSGGDNDDDGGGDTVDAAVGVVDGGGGSEPDAMSSGVADGQACAASEADPTGGCPTGYACLQTGCAQLCELGQDGNPTGAPCAGYEGPGVSLCIVTVQDQTGAGVAGACGIFCDDSTGSVPGCQGAACDGTCPNTLSCEQHPNPKAPAGLKICQ